MINDVMVYTPVLRLEPETVKAIFNLEWEGPLSLLFQRDNPSGDAHEDVLHQYKRARELFLKGPYDAMMVIESDIIMPVDTLQKLAALDVDCAYGIYRFRKSNVINAYERYPGNPRNEGESLSLHPDKLAAAMKNNQIRISGGGLGCVLIKRHVLEQIDFRMEPKGAFCDTYFNRDVMHAGMMQVADLTILCGHIDEDRSILWPSLPS